MKGHQDTQDIDSRLREYAIRWRASEPEAVTPQRGLVTLDTSTERVPRRYWYTAGTIAAGLAIILAVASSVAHQNATPVSATGLPQKPPKPSPAISPTPSATEAPARPCTASDLKAVRVTSDPATSTTYILVHLRNINTTSCFLGGKPAFLQATSNQGKPLLNYTVDSSHSGPTPGNLAPDTDDGLVVFATSQACPAPDDGHGNLRYSHISVGLGEDRGVLAMPADLEIVGTCPIDVSRFGRIR